jgi:hypothetical protein
MLALGTGLAANYALTSLFPPNAAINTWRRTWNSTTVFRLGV